MNAYRKLWFTLRAALGISRLFLAASSLSHRLHSPAHLDSEHRPPRQRQTAQENTVSTLRLIRAVQLPVRSSIWQHPPHDQIIPRLPTPHSSVDQGTSSSLSGALWRAGSPSHDFLKVGEDASRSSRCGNRLAVGRTHQGSSIDEGRKPRIQADPSLTLQLEQPTRCRTPAQAITRTSNSGCSSNSRSSSPLHDWW